MPYLVVTEHWPRNPSKPMWLHVETRSLKSAVDAEMWAETLNHRRQYGKKKSRCLGKTFVVKVLEGHELTQEIVQQTKERSAQAQKILHEETM